MSRYEDLGIAYGAWRTASITYMRDCGRLISQFADAFRDYLGAPENYRSFSSGSQAEPHLEKTVSVMEASRDGHGDIRYEKMDGGQFWPDLIRTESGNFIAAIRLVVEEAPNTYPKSGYFFPVFFSVRNGRCRIHVGEEHREAVEFDAADLSTAVPAFDLMINWLHDVYRRDPSEIRTSEPIGFIVSGRG